METFLWICVMAVMISGLMFQTTIVGVTSQELECPEGRCQFFNPLAPDVRFCIQKTMVCNGREECRNGTDETNCDNHVCEPMWFKCDGICKSEVFRCNGELDCNDLSDEEDCETYDCDVNRVKCKTVPVCIAKSDVCDGKHHCVDYSDEEGCFECERFAKKCDDLDSSCLQSYMRCDGIEECDSGSDEEMCDLERCGVEDETQINGMNVECKPMNSDHPASHICMFGFSGEYCNETCSECREPFCQATLHNENHYYKLLEYKNEDNPPCIPSDAETVELKSLHLQRIQGNLLTEISSQLTILRLSDVSYKCMDGDVLSKTSSNLIFLYLNDMNFTQNTLPSVKNLNKLLVLNLDRNKISSLPKDIFEGSNDIITISLSHNRLKGVVSDPFLPLRSLFELHLSFNDIRSDIDFAGLRSLRHIDLSHNCIDHVSETMFKDLRDLERLGLQGNTLTMVPFMKGVGLTSAGDLLVYVSKTINCSSVDTRGELMCRNFSLNSETSLGMKISDLVDDCRNDTCPAGEDCFDFIGGAECGKQFCDYNDCFLRKDLKCDTQRGDGLLKVEDGICLNPCICGENRTTCANSPLTISILDKLCLPRGTSTLELFNVTINEISFSTLMSHFDNISKVVLDSMHIDFLRTLDGARVVSIESLHLRDAKMNKTLLKEVPKYEISKFKALKSLAITHSNISTIEKDVFSSNSLLLELSLAHNEITQVSFNAFKNLKTLITLDMSYNKIVEFNHDVFLPLPNLEILNISKNLARNYPFGLLRNQSKLRIVHGDAFTICCLVAQKNNVHLVCTPEDEISSCERLIASKPLRILIWIQAFVTAIGNVVAIVLRIREYRQVGRSVHKKTAKINIFLIGMLGLADFFMCIYLFIIAGADEIYAGEYFLRSNEWLNSHACSTAGVLAIFSGEASVLFLSLITATRLLSVVQPLNYLTVDVRIFHVSSAAIWTFSILLAAAPLMGFTSLVGYFSGSSATCLPSFYTSTSDASWGYSFVIIFLNLLCFVMVLVAYMMLTYVVRRNNQTSNRLKQSSSSSNKSGRRLNIRVAILVVTDMLCWVPVCIIALYSLSRGGLDAGLHRIIYPVTAIILFPINSTLNPVIYTLLTNASISARFKAALSHLWSSSDTASSASQSQPQSIKRPEGSPRNNAAKGSDKQGLKVSGKEKGHALPGVQSGTCSTILASETIGSEEKRTIS